MTTHTVGIIMNGVTGRMGLNQHLRRSIWAIRQQGGLKLSASETIMPKPMLVGRNTAKLEAISSECGGLPYTTNLDEALANPEYSVYFDAQTTDRRAPDVRKAIAAGKHVYCEKPVADSLAVELELGRLAERAGITVSSGGSSACAASSATGYSRATRCRSSGRHGTIARRRAGASSSICC